MKIEYFNILDDPDNYVTPDYVYSHPPPMTMKKILLIGFTLALATNNLVESNVAQAQTNEFQSGSELATANKYDNISPIGRRVWLTPNLEKAQYARVGFARDPSRSSRSSSALLYPTKKISFVIEEKILRSEETDFAELYRISFEDGLVAYIESYRIDGYSDQTLKYTQKSITEETVGIARLEIMDGKLSESFFSEDPSILENRIKEIQTRMSSRARASEDATRRAEVNRLAKGGVSVGNSKEQVLRSNWGTPLSSRSTIVEGLVHEQWVYPGGNYLYFSNGKLTAIQTSE